MRVKVAAIEDTAPTSGARDAANALARGDTHESSALANARVDALLIEINGPTTLDPTCGSTLKLTS